MAHKTCSVAGCSRSAASSWGRLCNTHRSRVRRHGHPLQDPIQPKELVPYIQLIQRIKARNPDSEAWGILEGRWERLLEEARTEMALTQTGQAFIRDHYRYWHIALAVGRNESPSTVTETLLAMFAFWDDAPSRFRSDDAFRFELVQVFRKLGRLRDSELTPRVIRYCAQKLTEQFGGPGLSLYRKEMAKQKTIQSERARLQQALEDLE